MALPDFGSPEFDDAVKAAYERAFQETLAAGSAVFYLDSGLNVMEFPDGRRFEIEWIPGSGKSTITRSLEFEGHNRLLDPDAIARQLNPAAPQRQSPRERTVLNRTNQCLTENVSFVIETTLSSSGRLALIREQNTASRESAGAVAQGGLFVADVDVRRRYVRSLAMARRALPFCDIAKFYDNSERPAHLELVVQSGVVAWRADPTPAWVPV